MTEIKVGDKYEFAGKWREILAVHEETDTYFVLFEAGTTDCVTGDYIRDAWKKVAPQFIEDKTYRRKNHKDFFNPPDTWYIIKTYEHDGEMHVWTLYTNGATGGQVVTPLARNASPEVMEIVPDDEL